MAKTASPSTPVRPTVSPRILLARSLRANGNGTLCKSEKRDYSVGSTRLSIAIMCAVSLSLLLYAFYYLEWSLSSVVGSLLGFVLLIILLVGFKVFSATLVAVLILLTAAGCGLWLMALRHNFTAAAVVYGVPFLLVIVVRLGYPALRKAVRLPLFVPVAFIVVLSPLLTEDPWRLAAAAGTRLALLGVLTVLPLAALLAVQIGKAPTRDDIDVVIQRTVDGEDAAMAAAKLARKALTSSERIDHSEKELAGLFRVSYGRLDSATRDAITAAAQRRYVLRITRRLFSLLIGVASTTYLLIYLLAWAAMPIHLAEQWSGSLTPVWSFMLWGNLVSFPLGSYVQVSALLSILATAGFLAFAVTEDRYESAIHSSLMSGPIERLVLLGIPYLDISGADRSP